MVEDFANNSIQQEKVAAGSIPEAEELPMQFGKVRVSVRELVEFILRHGNIDNRHPHVSERAMLEGSKIHRKIQGQMGGEYHAEVPLRYMHYTDSYVLIVDGRADGIIVQDEGVTIDEIKGTYRDVERMREPELLHIAQAKCYAYIYSLQEKLSEISVRMTYCNMETENIRYFYEDYDFSQLERWFLGLIEEYRKWSDYEWEWRVIRQNSIDRLEFPFDYRNGQKELVSYVYQTIYHSRKLFIEAPTGVGKTISAIFPAIKAMGKNMGDRMFYLTAKTITRSVADDTLQLLRERGLKFKSVILTAKEKICLMDCVDCNPDYCPYAKGHYDRVNGAMYDLLKSCDRFDRETIEHWAIKYQVCPFEFCLDMSHFADGIIGDYNYLFDPHVYLKRFFAEGVEENYLFLVDEAHNLLERGREMYSASLVKEDFLKLKQEIRQAYLMEAQKKEAKKQVEGQISLGVETTKLYGYAEKLVSRLEKCNKELLLLKRDSEDFQIVPRVDSFVNALAALYSTISDYLEETEGTGLEVRDLILNFYFDVAHFLDMYERLDENYVTYTQKREDGSFLVKLFCVNPRENLKECMQRGRSTILFSATFLPIQYYKELLGGDPEDYEVYAQSVFQQEKRVLFIANDVTSKYSRRSEEEYDRIARYIWEIVKNRSGNYMVFFPSYSFMELIYNRYVEQYLTEDQECICQTEAMQEEEREYFLNRFRMNETIDWNPFIQMEVEEVEHTLIGFCVLGGIFGEGIDLKKDSLIGAIIVGTGLPMVCEERELLKNHFDEQCNMGFDYAYRFPGMNKVLQAAGRVIRTVEDVGIIALLDERFLQMSYRRFFPREWSDYETVNIDTISKRVERFWDSWL